MSLRNRAEPVSNVENRLRTLRVAKGLSQGQLASTAGITRQAVYAIEGNQYLPTTAVALRLARALGCRVEDVFSLIASGEMVRGEWITSRAKPRGGDGRRVKVARVGNRLIVRPVAELGDVLAFAVAADGLLMNDLHEPSKRRQVQVELLRDRRQIENQILVAGCDPSIYLVGEYLRRKTEKAGVVGWTMGSGAALQAVKRGEVHMAGIHVQDSRSGEWNLPYLKRHVALEDFTVITFAGWEEGLMVTRGNPKGIHDLTDLARKDIGMVNREQGAGARLLLDRSLAKARIKRAQVKGYERVVGSHLEVARLVASGMADVGIGVRSAANLMNLEFIALQEERYDLVVPKTYLTSHPGLEWFLETIVSRPFRTEIEALGGYDMRQTGTVRDLREP